MILCKKGEAVSFEIGENRGKENATNVSKKHKIILVYRFYMKINTLKLLEWGGVFTAILYSFLIAFNINLEFFGFFTITNIRIINWFLVF